MNRHPAKYTESLIPVFYEMLYGCDTVLDPFAGTGKIHDLPFKTIGVEIEEEWAAMRKETIHGDSTKLSDIFKDKKFDAICTSPTYGNRMADHHKAKDGSKRNTYTHAIGHDLKENNSGKMHFGEEYKKLHTMVYSECKKVLKDNGKFILNMKNHIKAGKEIDVFGWHVTELISKGFILREVKKVNVTGNGFGANSAARVPFEYVALFEVIK